MPRWSAAIVTVAACLLALLACADPVTPFAPAALAPLEPRPGSVYSGVATPGPERIPSFLRVSDQPSVAIYHRFSTRLGQFDWILDEFARAPGTGMISWQVMARERGSPGGTSRSIARGDIDAYLLDRAADARAYGEPLFIRPNWEMNAYFFPWGAYDRDGEARPGNSHAQYRNSWRRIVILFRGGTRAAINAKLAALGMPGVATAHARVAPVPNVAWVWNANFASNPASDDVFAYWPGDEYVDWTGVDWYPYGAGDGLHAAQATAPGGPNDVYARYSGPSSTDEKPFLIGEWSGRHADRPTWTADMFDWMQARPKVKGHVYFNYPARVGDHRLERHRRAARVFRHRVEDPRYLTTTADVSRAVPRPRRPSSGGR